MNPRRKILDKKHQRRNAYGESPTVSRKAIARRKRHVNRQYRRSVRHALDPYNPELSQANVEIKQRIEWRKYRDQPLQWFLNWELDTSICVLVEEGIIQQENFFENLEEALVAKGKNQLEIKDIIKKLQHVITSRRSLLLEDIELEESKARFILEVIEEVIGKKLGYFLHQLQHSEKVNRMYLYFLIEVARDIYPDFWQMFESMIHRVDKQDYSAGEFFKTIKSWKTPYEARDNKGLYFQHIKKIIEDIEKLLPADDIHETREYTRCFLEGTL